MSDPVAPPPFVIEIPSWNTKVILQTAKEVTEFLNAEAEAWSWARTTAFGAQALGNFSRQWAKLRNYDMNSSDYSRDLQNALSTTYQGGGTLCYHGTVKAFFDSVRSKSEEVASASLAFAVGVFPPMIPEQSGPKASFVRGGVELLLFMKGLPERASVEAASLAGIHSQYASLVADASVIGARLKDDSTVAARTATEALAASKEAHDKQLAKQADAFAKQLSDAQKNVDALTATYEQHMKLRAPVTYWANKHKQHNWAAVGAGVVFLMGVVGTIVAFVKMANVLLPTLATVVAQTQPGASAKIEGASPAVPVRAIAIMLAVSVLLVWVLRIIARVLLSQIHLAADAAERAVMAKTFLSLMRKGNAVKDDDVKVVLAALFRRTATGIIRDDALPLSPIEVLTRQSGRGGGDK